MVMAGKRFFGFALVRLLAVLRCATATTPDPWLAPEDCTSCEREDGSNKPLKTLGTGVPLEKCQAACVTTFGCSFINFAYGNKACQLYEGCANPWVRSNCRPHSWWTTFQFNGSHNSGAVWPPTEAGWSGRLKTFWFGANHTGLDSPKTLALMAKHSVAGYGWQTGLGGIDRSVYRNPKP